jgi:hypothetical protein
LIAPDAFRLLGALGTAQYLHALHVEYVECGAMTRLA